MEETLGVECMQASMPKMANKRMIQSLTMEVETIGLEKARGNREYSPTIVNNSMNILDEHCYEV